MTEKNRQSPGRIPVRFVDADEASGRGGEVKPETGKGGPSPEEIGRASSYEDETEVKRRIERGEEKDSAEGRERADDADAAGAPDPSELPQSRTDLDTTAPHAGGEKEALAGEAEAPALADPADAAPRGADLASGPVMAELIATRSELRRVEAELNKLSVEKHDLTDRLARRQADFDNYRKRIERERTETYSRAVGEVVSRLLPVLDNLRRALEAEASVKAGESEEFRHFLHGVELIEKQLTGALESLGVEAVPTVGEKFDPHIHEAVATEETDKFGPDTVTEEMQRGYRLGDKLLRPAMVKVSK